MDFEKEAIESTVQEIARGFFCGECHELDHEKCASLDGCYQINNTILVALRSAFRAGEEAMQKRAAGVCDDTQWTAGALTNSSITNSSIANALQQTKKDIRSLPLSDVGGERS